MAKNPNPQGKGLAPVMALLDESRATARQVAAKPIEQISVELFTSLFVLESDFRFRPVPGNTYWLYRKNSRFWLSPIGPHEWDASIYERHVGRCQLQQDLTWTLELAGSALADQGLMDTIEERRRHFEAALESAPTVQEALPGYQDQMPFYQRVYAFGLAHSLRASMGKSGIQSLTYQQARGRLPPGGA